MASKALSTSAAGFLRQSTTLNRLRPECTALLVCDLQDRFQSIYGEHLATVLQTCRYMLSVGHALDLPVMIATQQNPKKYGHVIPQCFPTQVNYASAIRDKVKVFDKKQFSMLIPQVQSLLDKHSIASVLIMGIETHVCVLHTCFDLIEQGIDVHVIVDGTTSRQQIDRKVALNRLANSTNGAFLTTAQTAAFSLMQTEDHARFNDVFKLTYEHLQLPNTFEQQELLNMKTG